MTLRFEDIYSTILKRSNRGKSEIYKSLFCAKKLIMLRECESLRDFQPLPLCFSLNKDSFIATPGCTRRILLDGTTFYLLNFCCFDFLISISTVFHHYVNVFLILKCYICSIANFSFTSRVKYPFTPKVIDLGRKIYIKTPYILSFQNLKHCYDSYSSS